MTVLIGQRSNREVYAEGERLWNGQAFLHFDCLCASANQKTGKECKKGQNVGMLSNFLKARLENFWAAGKGCDVADQPMQIFQEG